MFFFGFLFLFYLQLSSQTQTGMCVCECVMYDDCQAIPFMRNDSERVQIYMDLDIKTQWTDQKHGERINCLATESGPQKRYSDGEQMHTELKYEKQKQKKKSTEITIIEWAEPTQEKY